VKVLVCGSRDYNDREDASYLYGFLDGHHAAHPITALIHGGAPGADQLADDWGKDRLGLGSVTAYPAHWRHNPACLPGCDRVVGPGAGPVRNQQMLDEGKPDLVIAFPGGTGTADMVRRARKANVRVIEVRQ
jgi:hypothetical protein